MSEFFPSPDDILGPPDDIDMGDMGCIPVPDQGSGDGFCEGIMPTGEEPNSGIGDWLKDKFVKFLREANVIDLTQQEPRDLNEWLTDLLRDANVLPPKKPPEPPTLPGDH